MPKNDLHINENCWRHGRLFPKRSVHPMRRLGVILLVPVALIMLWWHIDRSQSESIQNNRYAGV